VANKLSESAAAIAQYFPPFRNCAWYALIMFLPKYYLFSVRRMTAMVVMNQR
jgi:hypothetical protein